MYKLCKDKVAKIEPLTFSELNMQENDIEEMLRKNIDMICDEEESMLIVGRQVRNAELGRSDLTAIDNNGNIVLIEIKRDLKDIAARKESFEFQAIRYAASYATIENLDDLVNKVYSPYIEKYRDEFKHDSNSLTSTELATRNISEFLTANNSINEFNKKQKIILVASDFDSQTLSAVAWLNNNSVNISCYKLIPYKINNEIVINIEKVLPINDYDDFYVDLIHSTTTISRKKANFSRRNLPRINDMLSWGIVKENDIIIAKDTDEEAILMKNGNVLVDGEEKSLQTWLKDIYGWSSVQTYAFALHKERGKTLSEIREEYMESQVKSKDSTNQL